jgi:glycosyltransferase involved in cell wall biosynthesis
MSLIVDNKLISIVIPVFNSENTIEELVNRLVDQLKNDYVFEIVLVNDYSDDNSENVCIELYQKYPKILKLYGLAKNVGEHNAVMAGLNNVSGDWVIIMDDDFQNPVNEVLGLIKYSIGNHFDVVYTWYKDKKHSFFRNFGSKFNNKVANVMLNKPDKLYLSSFKIIHTSIVKEIIKYDLPYPYIDGLILRTTRNIGQIEVQHKDRAKGKSGYTFKKLVSLWLNMFTNFSVVPLRISTILGTVLSIVGFVFAIATLIEKYIHPEIPRGYASIVIVLIIFSGVQLIFLGVIGEYLGRIFIANNKHPQFFITKKFE